MRLQGSTALFTAIGMLCGTCRADFKYSETTKVTGGAMMGAVKFVSVFSKNAKQAMAPTTRTVAIKGNKLREENSDGKIQIIDLDNRRFIEIDPQTKTYGIMTFDEMKQAMQRKQQEMQAKMKEEQAKHPDDAQKTNVKITPKFESSETGATRTILGLPTQGSEGQGRDADGVGRSQDARPASLHRGEHRPVDRRRRARLQRDSPVLS